MNANRGVVATEPGPTWPGAPLYRAERVAVVPSPDGLLVEFSDEGDDRADSHTEDQVIRIALSTKLAHHLRATLAGPLALADAAVVEAARPPASDVEVTSNGDGTVSQEPGEAPLTPVQWLTATEAGACFDQEAWQRLGMSGRKFLRRYDAGEFDAVYDDPDHRQVLHLSMLIPFVRTNP